MSSGSKRKDGNITWGPNDPRRCTMVEQRMMNPRSMPPKRHMAAVQCTLLKRHDGEHEWMGRKFGTAGAPPQKTDHNRGRCTAVEQRDTLRKGEWVTREVRCKLNAEHVDEGTPHVHLNIPFGTDMRARRHEGELNRNPARHRRYRARKKIQQSA
jgi:hypothetical protein